MRCVRPSLRALCLVPLVVVLGCADSSSGEGSDITGTTGSDGSTSPSATDVSTTAADAGTETAGTLPTAGPTESSTGQEESGSEGGASETGEPPNTGDWEAPIGIPVPSFGIVETAEEDCATCTVITTSSLDDLQNIPPGTVVELEGGPFNGGSLTISGNGTLEAPIFVRSKNPDQPVVISHDVEIGGSYLIVEHIDFDQGGEDKNVALGGDHVSLRHGRVHAFRPGHFSTALVVSDAQDVVIYDMEIHDNGDPAVVGEHDVHGIGGGSLNRLWVVDSHLHHNRGDSIQFGHQAGNTFGDIYIGRNEMHDDGENCVDIKEASNVVVSENDLHDPNSGVAVVFHDCPLNASLIYNEVHDANVGLSLPSLESACDSYAPIDIIAARNTFSSTTTAVEGWGSGKRYGIAGNAFEAVAAQIDIDNEGAGSILSTSDRGLAEVFSRFEAVYGIDISGG